MWKASRAELRLILVCQNGFLANIAYRDPHQLMPSVDLLASVTVRDMAGSMTEVVLVLLVIPSQV